jgi:hypothetical protein
MTIAIGHLGELIRAYVDGGEKWGLDSRLRHRDKPLNTMGPVVAILDRLPEQFLVLNGDILTDLSYSAMLDAHAAGDAPLTIATYRRQVNVDFGVLEVEAGKVVGFVEKPTLGLRSEHGRLRRVAITLADYPVGEPLGLRSTRPGPAGEAGTPASYPFDGYWLDIGRPEDYDRANAEFAWAAFRAAAGFLSGTRGRLGRERLHRKVGGRGDAGAPRSSSGRRRAGDSAAGIWRPRWLDLDLLAGDGSAERSCGAGSRLDRELHRGDRWVGRVDAAQRCRHRAAAGGHCVRSGVTARLVHLGSAAEYGAGVERRASRPSPPGPGPSALRSAKLAATELVTAATRGAGRTDAVVLRVFNAVGARHARGHAARPALRTLTLAVAGPRR